MNILEMTDIEIIQELAAGDEATYNVLRHIHGEMEKEPFRLLAIDLDDMLLKGPLIFDAYVYWSRRDLKDFLKSVTARDIHMVEFLTREHPNSGVRQHGEQHKLKPVDAAIKGLIDRAKEEGKLEELNEGSEYIHNFWLSMLTLMQKEKKFESNFKLNLAGIANKAAWAVFAIQLVELQDENGEPLKASEQPQNEGDPFPPPVSGTRWNDPVVEMPDDKSEIP